MARFDEDFENEEDSKKPVIDSKKILIFLLPVLAIIGICAGLFYFFFKMDNHQEVNYQMVAGDEKSGTAPVIFYDLPELVVLLPNEENSSLRAKINLELGTVEDISKVEAMLPRINDMLISHALALRPEEVSGNRGMYWLKEEFLHRINLLLAPVKVKSLNFKSFEFIKNNQ